MIKNRGKCLLLAGILATTFSIFYFLAVTDKIVRVKSQRLNEGKLHENDVTSLIEVTRAQRMKAELAELESEKQKLLAMKEITDLQEQLIDKRAEVKKLKATDKKVSRVKSQRLIEGKLQAENDVTRVQRMKAELAELESEKQKLLAMKEITDLQEQLIDKRAEVKKLKEEVAALQAHVAEINRTKEEQTKDSMLEDRFRHRLQHLQAVCKALPNNTFDKCEERAVKGNLYNVSHGLVYCSIEKSGSTFIRRILKVIEKGGKVKDPLKDLGLGAAYSLHNLKDVKLQTIMNMMSGPEKRNFMFVRDPYGRLYSGWLDKFYATNPYWWGLGKEIIMRERNNATNHSLECGHDVQFNEYVNFFAKDVKEKGCGIDGHFSASYRHCLPCGLPYNFIGKYETLREDIMYFLEKANLTHLVKISDFETNSDEDAIKDSSVYAFSQRKKVEKCMSFMESLQRVWKRLQNRGILNMKAEFPEKQLSTMNLTEVEFRNVLMKAYNSFNIEETKVNRELALQEAYSTVSQKSLRALQDAFDLDFKLFDYDKSPSFITRSR